MANLTTIPVEFERKFGGAAVVDLDDDDLAYLLRRYRGHPVLDRMVRTELRRRAKMRCAQFGARRGPRRMA